MKLQVLLLCLLLLVPAGLAQEDGHDHAEDEDDHDEAALMATIHASGPLYLQSAGTLASEPGSPGQECLAVDPQSGPQTAEFSTRVSNLSHHVASSTVTLSLAFTSGSTPGSGFRIDAELTQGDLATQAWKTFGPGTSLASPTTLAFAISEVPATAQPMSLSVTLTPTGLAGPLPALLDVGIQCQDEESLLYSFEYASFEPAMGDDHPDDDHDEGDINTLYVILISIGAAAVTLVAGILPLIGRALAPQRLHLFLGITAGLLLSIALVDLIPEAISEGGGNVAWTIALGVLVLYGVKHLAGETHDHAGHDVHPDHHAPDADDEHTDPHAGRFALVAFGALLFHRLVDGLALPGAFAAGGDVGIAASSAILLHQFPDGLAAASVFLAAGWRRAKVLWSVLILAFATPLGSLAGLAFANLDGALPHLLGLAAATFIFIALAELLPELRAKKYRFIVVVGFLLGYGLTFGIEWFAEAFGGGHGH